MKVYTLKNCDTCKKAVKWLTEKQIAFDNHDVRADGLEETAVTNLIAQTGWETLINRRSTTWRGLDEADREGIDAISAARLIADNPTLMKRPVFVTEHEVMVGWNDDVKEWLGG